jgi:hypothetical protein
MSTLICNVVTENRRQLYVVLASAAVAGLPPVPLHAAVQKVRMTDFLVVVEHGSSLSLSSRVDRYCHVKMRVSDVYWQSVTSIPYSCTLIINDNIYGNFTNHYLIWRVKLVVPGIFNDHAHLQCHIWQPWNWQY